MVSRSLVSRSIVLAKRKARIRRISDQTDLTGVTHEQRTILSLKKYLMKAPKKKMRRENIGEDQGDFVETIRKTICKVSSIKRYNLKSNIRQQASAPIIIESLNEDEVGTKPLCYVS